MSPHHPPKLAGTPELIFPWRGRKHPIVPKFLAVACVTGLFAGLLSVRVRLQVPEKSAPHRASVIFPGDSAEGRSLALRAREGGPFPARFDLSHWSGLAEIQAATVAAVSYQPVPYTPQVAPLPSANELQPLELAARGKSFFPARPPATMPLPDTAELLRSPVIYPLAGTTREAVPKELPDFTPTAAISPPADPNTPYRRFLLCLTAVGGVAEIVALEPGAADLETWLRRVRFAPDPAKPTRWIAVGIGFTNQPADGSDAR